MRKYMLAAAVAAAAIATPAVARDGAAYGGIEGGVLFGADTDFDVELFDGATTTEYDDAISLDYKLGWDLDGILGYDFGPVRLEGEVGWKKAKIDEVELSPAVTGDLEEVDFDLDEVDLDSRVSVLSGMVNVLGDFGDDDGFSFYVGGGAGRARVKFAGDKDSAWAWQLIAGARTALSESVDVGLKYRYFNTGNLRFGGEFDDGVEAFAFDADGKFSSHSVLASLIFNFGGGDDYVEPTPAAAPPPPPPPPPVAPPPPAMQTCPDGSTIPADQFCPPPLPPRAGERGK
jgi:opacity protein-like surface antigen